MLRSLYTMLDYHIAATDGELGRVQDFFFDDESWIVDYLVVDTATSPEKHEVLINPFAAGVPDWETKRLPVLLTCEQIRTSPPVRSDMPISRQRQSGLKAPGSHLRSMREVLGYSIYTADGEAGSIEDFIIEDTLWGIHHAIVGLGQPPATVHYRGARVNTVYLMAGQSRLDQPDAPGPSEATRIQRDQPCESGQRTSVV